MTSGPLLPSRPPQIAMNSCKSPQIAAFSALFRRECEHLLDVVPVDQIVEPGFEILWPQIAIVDVIRMLPDVAAKQRPAAVNQRVLAVRSLGDLELAFLEREPAPARAELGLACFDEGFAELVEAAKVA